LGPPFEARNPLHLPTCARRGRSGRNWMVGSRFN
jgi:hypothetical protein